MCSHTLRRLQWIVIDCKRNLQQRQTILYKKKLSVHIFQVHSEEFDELAPNTGLPVHVCCTFNELRSTFWLSDLVFPVLSDALGLSDNENLFTILVSIHPHHVFEKKYTGLPVLVMNSQLLFAGSLTSTLLDWLGYNTGFPLLVYPHSHIRLMLDLVSHLWHPALMMSEV